MTDIVTTKRRNFLALAGVGGLAAACGPESSSGATAYALSSAAPGLVNVRDPAYGAVGNGLDYDTHAIQAALNADAGGIYFPPADAGKNYLVDGTLSVPSNKLIVGLGKQATLRKIGSGPLFSVPSSVENVAFRDLSMEGDGSASMGVSAVSSENVTVYGCQFLAFGTAAIYAGNVARLTVDACTCEHMGESFVKLDGDNSSNVRIAACTFRQGTQVGQSSPVGAISGNAGIVGLHIETNYFEGCNIQLNGTTTQPLSRATVRGNSLTAPSAVPGIRLLYATHVLIAENVLEGVGGQNAIEIRSRSAGDIKIESNVVDGYATLGSQAHGIVVEDPLPGVEANVVTVTGNIVNNVSGMGIRVSLHNRIRVSDNVIKQTGSNGVTVVGVHHGVVSGNILSDAGSAAIVLSNAPSGTLERVSVVNNVVEYTDLPNTKGIALLGTSLDNAFIHGNDLSKTGTDLSAGGFSVLTRDILGNNDEFVADS